MRKPRDYDAELKGLEDRTKELKVRKVQQLGELVIATGADALTLDELADAGRGGGDDEGRRETGSLGQARRGVVSGTVAANGIGKSWRRKQRSDAAVRRAIAIRRRRRELICGSGVERRKRTKMLIELGGLVWIADKLRSDERNKALALWAGKGKEAFDAEHQYQKPIIARKQRDRE